MNDFQPAQLETGSVYRVRQTFYASGVPVQAGTTVRVEWVNVRVEERIYELTIALFALDPPGGTILWGRSHPLDQAYVDELFERQA